MLSPLCPRMVHGFRQHTLVYVCLVHKHLLLFLETWARTKYRWRFSPLGAGQQLQDMPVTVHKVDASSATAIVDLHIVQITRPAAVSHAFGFYPAKDGIKLCIAHVKGIVMALKLIPIVKIQSQSLIYAHRCKVPSNSFIRKTEDFGKPFR